MSKAKNAVIAGDYSGLPIQILTKTGEKKSKWTKEIIKFPAVVIKSTFKSLDTWEYVPLDKENVTAYEVITDEHRKSAASGVARGLVGGALIGPVGMLAGGLSAKTKGIYNIAFEFKDGKRSLVELNDEMYKSIIQSCF